jgi:hypothetical protein
MKNNKFFIEENLSEYRRGEIFNIFHGRVKVGVAYYHMRFKRFSSIIAKVGQTLYNQYVAHKVT